MGPYSNVLRTLELQPHPEGGFFRETFRSPTMLHFPDRPARSASTAIYFLLDAESFSALHRVSSDEVWHHYDGAPVDLHLIAQDGEHVVLCLGKDLEAGQRPQHVVPAGVWQAAVPRGDALCGCTVAPGFDFDDFEMPPREELVRLFPQHRDLLERLTR
jgi:uncharacterized protein